MRISRSYLWGVALIGACAVCWASAAIWEELYEEVGFIDPARGFQILKHVPLSVIAPAPASARGKEKLGVLASDVISQFPELVYQRDQGELSVDQDALFVHMLGAIQLLDQHLQLVRTQAQEVMSDAIKYSKYAIHTVEETASRDREALEMRIRTSSANTSVEALRLKTENARKAGVSHRENLKHRREMLQILFQQHSALLQQAVFEHESQLANLSVESTEQMLVDIQSMETVYFASAMELASVTFHQEVELLRHQSNTSIHAARASIEAKFAAESENLDVTIRLTQEKAKREREVWRTTALAASEVLQGWTIQLTSDPRLLVVAVASLFAVLAALQLLLGAISIVREYLQWKFSQPGIVTINPSSSVKAAKRLRPVGDQPDFAAYFDTCGIVLPADTATQLVEIAHSMATRHATGLSLPHVMIYGGPGTGKSTVAEALAFATGQNYVTVAGGDVAALGVAAPLQLRRLISWAGSGRGRRIIIVEEAEALLETRTNNPSEEVLGCLTTILAATSEMNNRFSFLFCTSHPDMIDSAIYDRVDHALHLGALQTSERERLARLLLDEVILKPGSETRSWFSRRLPRIDVSDLRKEDAIRYLVRQSEGWSGRDVHKTFLAAQASAHVHAACKLSTAMFKETVDVKYKELNRMKAVSKPAHKTNGTQE